MTLLRIAVRSTLEDARAKAYLHTLKQLFPQSALTGVSFVQVYTTDAILSASEAARAAKRLTNPLTERYEIGDIVVPKGYAQAIEVGFLPGVTDNVGRTAQQTIEDAIGRALPAQAAVYTSFVLCLEGKVSARDARAFAGELHNPLIERAGVYASGAVIPTAVPKVRLGKAPAVDRVDLAVSDAELLRISKEGIANADGTRRGPLALPLRSMKAIRDYFAHEGRTPTDIELEAIAQTWSEHCKHTIFADPLDEVREGIYRRYIKGATQKIRKAKGRKDQCVSVFTDNAGAIAFDKDLLVTHKVETHNAPSALDPFGGSVTAIVGVNRDCLGFGLGAKPIANVYGFCVGEPHDERQLYRDAKRTKPLLIPRRILEGVVKGINAGGNQSGIPTPLGFVVADPSYRGKPLVFGGTVGLIPRKQGGRKLYEKQANAGDYVVMLGGRVGLDGIHGATFSSVELSQGSPATAVQIGDPITQKKLSDALIREARDAGLYSSITDDGAGGLSGSVGEMAKESGGALIDLEAIPLKYDGLSPWQIWLSESQERMTLAVPKKSWPKLKAIFDRHDVEATVIGTFTDSGQLVVRHHGTPVLDLSLDFLHDGRPIETQKTKKPKRALAEPSAASRRGDPAQALLKLLARPSIASTAFIARQYDHEVQGSSVLKPLQGRGQVSADAGVIRPVPTSPKGVVLSHGYTPWYSQLDTYAMAAAAIDTAVRNAVAAGADRQEIAILDNFCWSSSEKPERLHELKEAAKACYDTAVAYGTPLISGKDSMFNDFRGYDAKGKQVHVAALPTLLVSAIAVVPSAERVVSLEWKRVGDLVYVLGETNDELGGSAYFTMLGATGKRVPRVDMKKNAKTYDALAKAIRAGLVASATSVGRGGLGVALARAAVGSQLGAELDLTKLRGGATKPDAVLFSESQGRILVSVRRDAQKKFEALCKGVALSRVGEVVQEPLVSIRLGKTCTTLPVAYLTTAYRSYFKDW